MIPSYNIIFKQQLLRNLGLRRDFEEEFQQTTPLGFMNTKTLAEITENQCLKELLREDKPRNNKNAI